MTTTATPSPPGLRHLPEQLLEAAALPSATWDAIRALSEQIDDVALLPLIGAGASIDCAGPSTKGLAKQLASAYESSVSKPARASDFKEKDLDLGAMADAVFLAGNESQQEVIDALQFVDETMWPPVDQIPDHFCGYRVLARLAREGFLSEAMTLNYDCNFERGLRDEGFALSRYAPRGRAWLDHATVIADAEQNASFRRRGAFVLTKAHGCVQRYRDRAVESSKGAAESIVVRQGQLLDWRTDLWARDVVTERTRRHVLLLLGFSGTDPVINITLTRILHEVREQAAPSNPRVVVIDRNPRTIALEGLISAGRPEGTSTSAAITSLSSDGSSITAVTLALLVVSLRLRLDPLAREIGYTLPTDPEPLLAALIVAAPQALRWAYLLAPPDPVEQHAQWINLEQAAKKGYVPLASAPLRAARALHVREVLRAKLGIAGAESITDVLAANAFIQGRGIAYLPTGLNSKELKGVSPASLRQARETLPFPVSLDAVLVASEDTTLSGIAVDSGKEVPVP
ncbi:MAG TPA: SIR2 family protein [Solirubrobacterales bacterium]|nr:SIR2 family protein [Solirubrobacterales bacterium]